MMGVSSATIIGLALQCAPNVAPQTVVAIVKTESGGNPIALNVNRAMQPARPSSVAEATAVARAYVARGYSVDLGLGQINSRNMRALGLTWENVFDPCTNITALGTILTQNYVSAAPGRTAQTALRVALSMYNTGHASRGFRNGYVAKVVGNAMFVADAVNRAERARFLKIPADSEPPVAATRNAHSVDVVAPSPAPPAWNLFERAAYDRSAIVLNSHRGGNIWID